MKKFYYRFLFYSISNVLLITFSASSCFSQIYNSSIKEKFNFKEDYILNEKIYFHSDRSEYVTGENVLFKAYYFLNRSFGKDSISKIVYLDLVDKNGQSKANGKYQINKGMANGILTIPQGLASGYYKIYAYTKWMMNFGNDCFFNKRIYIVNPENEIKVLKENQLNDENIQLHFYAEGGYLNVNEKNTISVLATNYFGETLNKNVKISDQDNNFIAEFQTPGHFDFVPTQNKEYKAIITMENGPQLISKLPKAIASGIKVTIDHLSNENLRIGIELTDVNNPDSKELKILLENAGLVYKQIAVKLSNNKYDVDIYKKDLIKGFNWLYIKNKNDQIIYKNAIINRLNHELPIDAILNKEVYHKRERVDIKIKTKALDKNSKNAHLSVSVAKSDLLNTDTCSIHDYLNDSYKKHNYIERVAMNGQSDILFNLYSDTIKPYSEITYLPETSGFIISGTILSKQTDKPIPNANIYLSTLSNFIDVQNYVSNNDGKFYFLMNEKVKNTDFVIQPADTSLKDFEVVLDKEFATDYPSDDLDVLREKRFNRKFFNGLVISHQIEKQYYSNIQFNDEKPGHATIFYGDPDLSYDIRKYIDLPTFAEYFTEIFTQTKIENGENGKQIKLEYLKNKEELNKPPLILIDGIPVLNVNKFLSIPPSEIEKVEIIYNYYVLGRTTYGGIFHLYTKKKNSASLIYTKNLSFYKFVGFTGLNKLREIKYTDENDLKSRKADFRNTLYWNPEIITGENGESTISFYTSDEKGKFLITIEGVGENGETGNKQMILEVE
jgi:hypothetical protein